MLETWIFRVNLFPPQYADRGKAEFLRCGGGGVDVVGVGSAKSQNLGMALGDSFLKVVLEFEEFISRNFPHHLIKPQYGHFYLLFVKQGVLQGGRGELLGGVHANYFPKVTPHPPIFVA
jgi:hypothetical protein